MATITTDQIPAETPVKVVRKHHVLVRISHWLNIPFLLGLGLSGLSIYWADPVFKHTADSSGNEDYLADIGRWIVRHIPGQHGYKTPGDWVYNHFAIGTSQLAYALQVHWLFAYLFMANGLLYLIGLAVGGGYRALLPRKTDIRETFAMIRYYLGLLPANIRHKPWPHPVITTKYNALQRGAYFSMPIAGILAVASGWALHKPQQIGWLQALFGGYDWARVWHFWLMWFFALFVIPHVILVVADGWDTFRSMVVGWSDRVGGHSDGKHE